MGTDYCLYFMSSQSNKVLYVGMTNNLARRVAEHKAGISHGFTAKYHCDKLVYFEAGAYVNDVIAREKQVKKWRRAWKDSLVETMNPDWEDLAGAVGVTDELVAYVAARASDE
jgi:putative endonuclease